MRFTLMRLLSTLVSSLISFNALADIALAIHGPDNIALIPDRGADSSLPALVISHAGREQKVPLTLPAQSANPTFRQMTVKQLSNLPVYFGALQTHANTVAVFHYCDTDQRALPTETVTLPVQGINIQGMGNLLSGSLTASYDQAQPRLTGHLSNGELSARFSSVIRADGSFYGTVKLHDLNRSGAHLCTGRIHGHLGWAGETFILVGLATFKHKANGLSGDFAFGGSRGIAFMVQPPAYPANAPFIPTHW
ncbi:hypothetical protein ACU5P1_16715 [Pseudomonas plecoglossicida]|uniref:Uncharacterized protein n=1 Tax=Pseudomonas plecoglossicida TaxID=70775 RepID=A0AAD0VRX9_PSEDL|nr:hypothetical protein [Pseudomonas plecoglossicida]AXM95564.1 hypothetical protein DVB73_06995 [Pseudomonas plecoglossicida]EPB94370.1 hypothetical protein L321_18532 [Pseudomonas plecoglossicida NB2011]QLB56312.1 hypothetical protein HAV28_16540 [Pseudomonas plecoglossicida]GLR37925.1 hypothetical protein GCM10011247_33230 [Pseudomonas plecoglossicida]